MTTPYRICFLSLVAALLVINSASGQVQQASEEASVALLVRAKGIAAEAERLADLAEQQRKAIMDSASLDDFEVAVDQLTDKNRQGNTEFDEALDTARVQGNLMATATEAIGASVRQGQALLASAQELHSICLSTSRPDDKSAGSLDAYAAKAAGIDADATRNLAVASEQYGHCVDYELAVSRVRQLYDQRRLEVERIESDLPHMTASLQAGAQYNAFLLDQLSSLNGRITELANLVRTGVAGADPGLIRYEALARDSSLRARRIIDLTSRVIADKQNTLASTQELLKTLRLNLSPPELPSFSEQAARAESRLGDVRQLTTDTRAVVQAVRECLNARGVASATPGVDAILDSLGVPPGEPEPPPPVVSASTTGLAPGDFSIEAITLDTVTRAHKGRQYQLVKDVANVNLIVSQGGRQYSVHGAQALQMAMKKGLIAHVPGLGFVSTGRSLPGATGTTGAGSQVPSVGGTAPPPKPGASGAAGAGGAGGMADRGDQKPSGDKILGQTVRPGAETVKTEAEKERDRRSDQAHREYKTCQDERMRQNKDCLKPCGNYPSIDALESCIKACNDEWAEYGRADKACRKAWSDKLDELYRSPP